MSKKLIALLAGGALAAFSALPANAELINNVDWDIDEGNLEEVDDNFYGSYGLDGSDFSISLADADDWYTFDCSDSGSTTELDGDFIYACEGFEDSGIPGIQWNGHVKVFAGDYNGLVARQVVSLSNTTAEDIVLDYEYTIDTEECYYLDQEAGVIGTPDGDLTVDDGENWFSCANDNEGSESIAFGTDGFARGDRVVTANDFSDDEIYNQEADSTDNEGFGYLEDENIIDITGPDDFYVWNADVTVPAGETLTFVYFYRSVGAIDHGSTADGAETDAEILAYMDEVFGSVQAVTGNTRLFEDIESAYNWGDVPQEEALAETGLDASGIALGGIAVLAAGVAVVARRRARA